jgi:hypothetical protein
MLNRGVLAAAFGTRLAALTSSSPVSFLDPRLRKLMPSLEQVTFPTVTPTQAAISRSSPRNESLDLLNALSRKFYRPRSRLSPRAPSGFNIVHPWSLSTAKFG